MGRKQTFDAASNNVLAHQQNPLQTDRLEAGIALRFIPAYGPTVLVTGANGFVGRTLCSTLRAAGCEVRKVGRRLESTNDAGLTDGVIVGDIEPDTDWTEALAGIDVVVHLAARVHIMQDTAVDPLAEFRKVNVTGTERLARQAAAAGVRRLIFISSIKVNGEATGERAFSEDDPSAPQVPYGVSKWEAEQALKQIAAETGLEVVIVRPALIYGPGVKGNFLRLLRLIEKGIPLPLASVDNWRSLISLWNLCDLLERCITHPHAAGETFLAADGEDLSTPRADAPSRQGPEQTGPAVPLPARPALFRGKAAGPGGDGRSAVRFPAGGYRQGQAGVGLDAAGECGGGIGADGAMVSV